MSKQPTQSARSLLSLIHSIELKSEYPSGPIFPHQIQQHTISDNHEQLKRIREYVERLIIGPE